MVLRTLLPHSPHAWPNPSVCCKLIPNKRYNRILALAKKSQIVPLPNLNMKQMTPFLKFVISPGTLNADTVTPVGPLPTGGNMLVNSLVKQYVVDMTPDPSGSIVVLGLPFFEAPFVRIMLDAQGNFDTWYPFQLPDFEFDPASSATKDPLKVNKFYAYRFTGQSMTGHFTGAPLNAQGSVSAWYQPLSVDTKTCYNSAAGANPLSYIRTLDRVPIHSNEIASVTKNQYSGDAVNGIYIVNRHTDRSVPFTYRNCDLNKSTVTNYFVDGDAIDDITSPKTVSNYLAFADDSTPGEFLYDKTGNYPLPVSAPTCMDVTGVIFQNLAPNQPVTFKFTVGIELVPKMGCKTISFAQQMPAFNEQFLRSLAEAELRLKRIGTAKDNDIGSFFSTLDKIVSGAAGVAKVIAPALPPAFGAAVSAISNTLPKITNALNNATNAAKSAAASAQQATNAVKNNTVGANQVMTNFQNTGSSGPVRISRRNRK